jgi:hypothetical protein
MGFEHALLNQVRSTALGQEAPGQPLVGDCQEIGPEHFQDSPERGHVTLLGGRHFGGEQGAIDVRISTSFFHHRICLLPTNSIRPDAIRRNAPRE